VSDAAGVPIDLTAAAVSLSFAIMRSLTDAAILLVKTKAAGGITVGADGTYTVRISASDKSTLPPGQYFYALFYSVSGGGSDTTVARGKFLVLDQAAVV